MASILSISTSFHHESSLYISSCNSYIDSYINSIFFVTSAFTFTSPLFNLFIALILLFILSSRSLSSVLVLSVVLFLSSVLVVALSLSSVLVLSLSLSLSLNLFLTASHFHIP